MNNMMKPQEMFGDLWKVAGPRPRKIMRRISLIGEKRLKPALARLQIVSEHCIITGQQDLLFEAGLIDYSELEVINEGWMDDLKKPGAGLFDRIKDVAKAGTELVRRPPQKGEFKDELDVLELFKLVGMQYGGVDVQGVKKELGDNWDDLAGAAGGAKEALVQAMKTVKGAMKDLLGQVGKLNEWIDKQGRKFQEIGIVQWADKTVDDKLANFNKALQDYQNKKEEPGSESESKEDSTPKLIQYASKIGEYAKKHPIKAALPIVILTMAATILVGPIAAIAVGLFLRTGLGMLKSPNEKFSSALGSAAKVAAVGLAAGEVLDVVGGAIGGGAEAGAEGAVEAGAEAAGEFAPEAFGLGDEYAATIKFLVDKGFSAEQIADNISTPSGQMTNGLEDMFPSSNPSEIAKEYGDSIFATLPKDGNPIFNAAHGVESGASAGPDDAIESTSGTNPNVDFEGGVPGLTDVESQQLAKELAERMGTEYVPKDVIYKGGVPTTINGIEVPDSLLTPEQLMHRNLAIQMRDQMPGGGIIGDSHNLTGPVLFEAKKTVDTSEYML